MPHAAPAAAAPPPPPPWVPPPAAPPPPLQQPRRTAPRPYCPPMGGAGPQPCGLAALQPPGIDPFGAAGSLLPPFLGLALNAGVGIGVGAQVLQLPLAPLAPAPPPPPPAVPLKECCICLADMPAEEMLLLWPCAHRCLCQPCADALMATPPPAPRLCPKCRQHVQGACRVYE
jgi:hypothetical protein